MAPPAPLTPYRTYTLAHTAQCKLNIAANRPDRNLRFVLGHAVLLDSVLVRIVEIENQSAKDAFSPPPSRHNGPEFDCSAAAPAPNKSSPLKQSSTATNNNENPAAEGKRRVSFQDNNARPNLSSSTGAQSPRSKSPPPKTSLPAKEDDDDTSSDDYDFEEPAKNLAEGRERGTEAEAAPVDEYDEEDEDDGLSLTRFASASGQKPRRATSPPPALSASDSSDEEDEPVSPPAFPADLDVTQIMQGPEDTELGDLYESVRKCRCHGHNQNEEVGEKGGKMWSLPQSKDAGEKKLGLMSVGRPVAVAAA